MTAIANLPDLRPSLLLDFANSGRVDPRIQCTRASSATCFGPDGKLRTVAANVPRIDYDHVTGKCLGLLVESQRSNLLINSVALSGYTQGANGTYSAGRIGIDGITPSMRVVANAIGSVYLTRSAPVVAGAYTASIYVCANAKPSRGELFRLEEIQADGSKIFRTLPFTNASIIADGKWRRYELTVTHAAAGTCGVFFAVDLGVGEQIDVCAAQYEAGAKASSYIPTAASAVTRAAETALMSGTNFTSWYRQDEGTLLAESSVAAYSKNTISEHNTVYINDGTTQNRMGVRAFADSIGNLRWDSTGYAGGVTQWGSTQIIESTPNTLVKNALTYIKDSVANSVNGSVPSVDTSAEIPNLTQISFGSTHSFASNNQHIRRIAYYPRRITNEQLQRITA